MTNPLITKLALAVMLMNLMSCQQVALESAGAPPADSSQSGTVFASEMSIKERDIVAKLQWVKTANSIHDAHEALLQSAGGKVELIAFSGRGISFPGLTAAKYSEIKNTVRYRIVEGSGDVIYGPTHKTLRKDLQTYASEYNRIIYNTMSSHP